MLTKVFENRDNDPYENRFWGEFQRFEEFVDDPASAFSLEWAANGNSMTNDEWETAMTRHFDVEGFSITISKEAVDDMIIIVSYPDDETYTLAKIRWG